MPVNLGTSENFAVLAKAGVSRTGVASIKGDVGVSPIAATAITGFALILDASSRFSTSIHVEGHLYASDYSDPTPSMMTTAVSDMETAFVDAAGRTLPNATELGAGDVSGITFPPGLYKWSSGVYADSTGFVLSGGADDVWIFQIAKTLLLASGSTVTLQAGAQAKNIYWQVQQGVTLGTTSVLHGNVLCATAVVLHTGSTLNGRALAQTFVTADGTVNEPGGGLIDVECCVNGSTKCNPTNGNCSLMCDSTVLNCLWCSSLNSLICETAADGYHLENGVVTQNGACEVSVLNCLSCSPLTSLYCESCVDGLVLVDATCVAGKGGLLVSSVVALLAALMFL